MLQRIALFGGALAAALTMAAAAAIAGLAPASTIPVGTTTSSQVAAPLAPASTPQVDTIYLTTPPQQTVVVHKGASGRGGEHEGGETEGAGGDD